MIRWHSLSRLIPVVCLLTAPLPAQASVWIRTGGPPGGLGYDVRIHPTDKRIMFVTDNPSGVNKTYDGAAEWVKRNEGITTRSGSSGDGIPIFCLTIDPNDPEIVWAGTQNALGVYKSTDGGETWVEKTNGIVQEATSFRNFGIRPGNSSVVFAGVEISTGLMGIEFDKARGRIYKTEDGGENWRCVWEGGSLVRFVLFDPGNPDVMYASTGIFDREAYNTTGIGLLKSTDGGESWTQINTGIRNLFVGFLEMHPSDPQILFAAAGNNAWSYPPNNLTGDIYRTTNGGGSWEVVLSDDTFTAVTISPSNPNVIYAGSARAFYRSSNGGDTWVQYNKPADGCWGPTGIRAGVPIGAVVDPDDPNTVFANNYGGGVFKSTDGAQTWIDLSKGYTGAHLHDVAVDPDNPSTVYTIGRSGPYRSYNGGAGAEWTGLCYAPAGFAEWCVVALNPANPREVIVTDEHQGVIERSTDAGDSWTEVFRHPLVDASNPLNRHGFKALAYAPSDPSIVYGGMSRERNTINGGVPPGPSHGVYKSTDAGVTWQNVSDGLDTPLLNILCMAVHPSDPDIVYLGTWKDGVFKTTDGGQTWSLQNNGLAGTEVRALTVDPQHPEVVYAGMGEGAGIFKSTNGGDLWAGVTAGLNLECPSYLLPIGRAPTGVSLEKPRFPIPTGEYYAVPWTAIWDIAIDPTDPQTIYAADHTHGVYQSSDGGSNWSPLLEGLSTRAANALAISADGRVLYAATEGEGIFVYGAAPFRDIPAGHWATEAINACIAAGIVSGFPDGTYRALNVVTRDQMAVFISRALAGGDGNVPTGPATATFSDVPTDHWAFRYVEYAVDHGVVGGYEDGTYRPTLTVTRDQMAVFIARALAGGDTSVPTGPATATFPDVPTDHWAFKYVEYIRGEGVTEGYPDGTYRPEVEVTRDQMAVYVQRAFALPM